MKLSTALQRIKEALSASMKPSAAASNGKLGKADSKESGLNAPSLSPRSEHLSAIPDSTTRNNQINTPMSIKLLTATLDGKPISYSTATEFLVQVGKGRSAYQTRYSFTGNLGQAIFYYRCINIGNGYKKRLYAPAFNRPTLAKQFS